MATTSPDRIVSLDLIRGFAVLGIFSVNIIGMAFMQGVYFQPILQGFDGVGDKAMYLANFVLVDGKLRCLFSMLFGASMLLVIDRAVEAGKAGWRVHYPRIFWLLVIGLAHYYILWWGDILSHYAMIGALAYLWWKRSAKVLIIWSAILLFISAIAMPVGGAIGQYLQQQEQEAEQAAAAEATDGDAAATADPDALAATGKADKAPAEPQRRGPPPEMFEEAKAKHESPASHLEAQLSNNPLQPFMVSVFLLPETLGYMLLGMALYRIGFLTGEKSDRVYRKWALWGLGGLALYTAGVAAWIVTGNYDFMYAGLGRNVFTPWTRPLMAMGYAAVLILWIRGSGMTWLSTRLAAVGRMAFTNYLSMTLIMTPFMFGFGFGLFGELTRGTAWLYFVPAMWLGMLMFSKWWLDQYRYGPLEWVWRSLSRWQLQPMRKGAPAIPAAA